MPVPHLPSELGLEHLGFSEQILRYTIATCNPINSLSYMGDNAGLTSAERIDLSRRVRQSW